MVNVLKSIFWTLAVLVFVLFSLASLWISASSGYYLRVLDLTYHDETGVITVTREVLSKNDVIARWSLSVQSGDGDECSANGVNISEPRYVDGTPKNTAVMHIPQLVPCLEGPHPEIVGEWQVMLWGVLPLKPTFFFKPARV